MIIPALTAYSTLLAFIGAFIGGLTVYLLSGSARGMTPVKLALAGMAIHLFFSSLTQGIILLNEDSTTTVMFWLVGSLSSIKCTNNRYHTLVSYGIYSYDNYFKAIDDYGTW